MIKKEYYKAIRAQLTDEDCAEYLILVTKKIMRCERHEAFLILGYFIEHQDELGFESLTDYLMADNGPIVRRADEMKKLFPELALISDNGYKIMKLANEYYGCNFEYIPDEFNAIIISYSFNFKEINPKRPDLKKVREALANIIFNELGGE